MVFLALQSSCCGKNRKLVSILLLCFVVVELSVSGNAMGWSVVCEGGHTHLLC